MSSENNGRVCNQLVYHNSLTEQPFHGTEADENSKMHVRDENFLFQQLLKLGSDKKDKKKKYVKKCHKNYAEDDLVVCIKLSYFRNYHKPLREMFNEVMRKFSHRTKKKSL